MKPKRASRSIYVVKSDAGPVKIGVAADMRKRFSNLRAASPVSLSLAYIAECSEASSAEALRQGRLTDLCLSPLRYQQPPQFLVLRRSKLPDHCRRRAFLE